MYKQFVNVIIDSIQYLKIVKIKITIKLIQNKRKDSNALK